MSEEKKEKTNLETRLLNNILYCGTSLEKRNETMSSILAGKTDDLYVVDIRNPIVIAITSENGIVSNNPVTMGEVSIIENEDKLLVSIVGITKNRRGVPILSLPAVLNGFQRLLTFIGEMKIDTNVIYIVDTVSKLPNTSIYDIATLLNYEMSHHKKLIKNEIFIIAEVLENQKDDEYNCLEFTEDKSGKKKKKKKKK